MPENMPEPQVSEFTAANSFEELVASDETYAELSRDIRKTAAERFGNNVRVTHEVNGDDVVDTLQLKDELDLDLFMDELSGFGNFRVEQRYKLAGKPDELIPEVIYIFQSGEEVTKVTFADDDVPLIERSVFENDVLISETVEDMTPEYAFMINNARIAVEKALDEADAYANIHDRRRLQKNS